jgi:two-component system sensor histidine kinase KdpD
MVTTKSIQTVAGRAAIGIVASLLITSSAFQLHFDLASATSVHLLLITAIAVRWGFIEASIVSILSAGCLDYFFTQPLFEFYMSDAREWVALITFESVALVVSSLSNQINQHAQASQSQQSQLRKFSELCKNVLLLDPQGSVEQQLVNALHTTLEAKAVALWNASDMRLSSSGELGGMTDDAHSTYCLDKNEDDVVTTTSRRILRLDDRPIGSLVIYGHSLDSASIDTVVSLTALAIERAYSLATESSAEAAHQSEQLRSTILDGLAHAFKSPLTAIMSSSSGLLEMNGLSGTEKRLVTLIDQQASHLNDLTNHLLRTARLDRSDLKVQRESVDVASLIQSSIKATSLDFEVGPIIVGSIGTISLCGDRQLLQMAFLQLLDNAAKYRRPGSTIAVDVKEEATEILISVCNEGSFIPSEERDKVFQRFYRSTGTDRVVTGTGIGLSVVRRITEAHHGRTWVSSDRVSGTTFVVALPRATKEI